MSDKKILSVEALLEEKMGRMKEVIKLTASLGITDALKTLGVTYYEFDCAINQYPDLNTLYLAARKERADYLANEVVGIADTETNPHKARVRIEARRWLASKMNASVYGDKIDIQVSHAPDLSGALEAARNRALGTAIGAIGLDAKESVIGDDSDDLTDSDNDIDDIDDMMS